MLVPIINLAQHGIIQDIPAWRLPPNAWSDGNNVRFMDGAVWKGFGEETIMGTPSVTPYFHYFFLGPSANYWAYFSEAAAYATDGATHSDITNVGGPYTGGIDDRWNAAFLGGIPIFNNGVDVPQAWINPSLGTPLIDLANWPAATVAAIIRSFKQYLIAMDVTKSGIRYPYLVKWSHVADPGSVPSSWDETNPANDAGEYPLVDAETGGALLDGLALGDTFYIYKENAIWSMNYIGGRFIFSFRRRFGLGPLSSRCVFEYKDQHIVASPEDLIIHNGTSWESLLDDKLRRAYKGRADPSFVQRSFIAKNPAEDEIWVCLPEFGMEWCNIAFVLNLKDGTGTMRDLPNLAHLLSAPFDPTVGATTYDSQTIPFDSMIGSFGQKAFLPGLQRLVGVRPVSGSENFILLDEGFQKEGAAYRGYIEKASSPIAGVDRYGQPFIDAKSVKQLNEVWPEVRLQNGTEIDIYVGGQLTLDDPIAWQGPYAFRPGVDDKIDCYVEGRYLSVRFESNDSSRWKLDSYQLNIEDMGRY